MGILGLVVIAPNVFSVIRQLEIGYKKRKKNLIYSINSSFTRLKEKGLIEIININGKKVARVTKKGEDTMSFLEKHRFKLKIPKKWDNRWRVVIFDVKESKKSYRDSLRKILSEIGFIKLQNSVWIYPYDCEDLVFLVKSNLKMGGNVLYMIVEKLENDWHLRKKFKLIT